MEKQIIYVHGKGGSVEEAEHFKPLFPESEIIGFDYRSQTPWEAREEFPAFFAAQRQYCGCLTLIANSIGAYFSLSALDEALELFSERGYDAVSVGEIAQAVGIKAPSLYNRFPGKQAIFDAIVESTAAQYEADTDRIDIHVQGAARDVPIFTEITEDALFEKVRQIFEYSLRSETIRRFRRMMTIEHFRSPELAALYSRRYVDRMIAYHAGIFRALIAAGEMRPEAPETLAMMYVSPVLTLIAIRDRQPEREAECLEKLRQHVALFYRMGQKG